MYNVSNIKTWWLFLAMGHSYSTCNSPDRLKTATWKRLPCESPTKTSPASEISIPFGKLVTPSQPILRLSQAPAPAPGRCLGCPGSGQDYILQV
uniref:Secreted protein n=1 Tax=Romanomermis culicivorax TaxID=13658 RepID=A0A915JNH9_ROMCU